MRRKYTPARASTHDAGMAEKKLKLATTLLKASPRNARTIEAPALRGLGVSMETFGDLSGIVWNERSGELVAGHQRMNRLKAAGAIEWVREGDRGVITHPKTGEQFIIRIVDWDETTERMANLTANNPAIQGDFTEEAAAQLKALEEEARFGALALDDLHEEMEREVARAEAAATKERDEAGEQEEPEVFAVLIPCQSEKHQRELLTRLAGEGLRCRAVVGTWSMDTYQGRPAKADAEQN